jgi:hypothetical protein
MKIISEEGEVKEQEIEELDFTKWSTPCDPKCPLISLYPSYHQPHYPLYPILCTKCNTEEAV